MTTLTSGSVDLRAVVTDTSGRSDTAATMITVTIDPESPTSTQHVVDGSLVSEHQVVAELGADAASAAVDGSGANILDRVPGDALTTDSQVLISFVPSDSPALSSLSQHTDKAVDLTLSSGQATFPGGGEPMLLFRYPDSNNDGQVDGTSIAESTLKIYHVEADGSFTALAEPFVDTQRNTVRGRTSTFSRFVLLGSTPSGIEEFWQYD